MRFRRSKHSTPLLRDEIKTWVSGDVWGMSLLVWVCYVGLVVAAVYMTWTWDPSLENNWIRLVCWIPLAFYMVKFRRERVPEIASAKNRHLTLVKELDEHRARFGLTRAQYLVFEPEMGRWETREEMLARLKEVKRTVYEVWKPKPHFFDRVYGAPVISVEVDVPDVEVSDAPTPAPGSS